MKVVAYLSLEPRALEYLCIVNFSCVDFDDFEMFRLHFGIGIINYSLVGCSNALFVVC